jgi:uncharacterized membrane protein HdeD (DUF308 family)
LAIVVIAFPIFTIGYLVTLFGIGLAFIGIARIVHGIFDKKNLKVVKSIAHRNRYLVYSCIIYGLF